MQIFFCMYTALHKSDASSGIFDISIREQVLVQVGDILDRGEDEIAILSLLKSLDIQAKANGGAVFQVYPCYLHICLISIFIDSCKYNEQGQLHQPCYSSIFIFLCPF